MQKDSVFVSMDILWKLFPAILNFKWVNDEPVPRNTEGVKQEHLSLLLSWPSLLGVELIAKTVADGEIQKKLNDLKEMLEAELDYKRVRDQIDLILRPKDIPNGILDSFRASSKEDVMMGINRLKSDICDYMPNLFLTLSLLLKNANPIIDFDDDDLSKINTYFGNYLILTCILGKMYERNVDVGYLYFEELFEIMQKCGWEDEYLYLILSNLIQTDQIQYSDPSILVEGDIQANPQMFEYTQVSNLQFSVIFTEGKTKFAAVKRDGKENKICGFAYTVNPSDVDYELWNVRIDSGEDEKKSKTFFIFNNNYPTTEEVIKELFYSIYFLALNCTKAVFEINRKWKDFLSSPYEIIEQKIGDYDPWLESILSDYYSTEAFLKFKKLEDIICYSDIEVNEYKKFIIQVRNEYIRAKKDHISLDDWIKLHEADQELKDFRDTILEKGLEYPEKYIKYFDENRSDFKYLHVLTHNDLTEMRLSTESHAMRHNRQLCLPIINKKVLGGRDFAGSRLTKLLGLETSTEDYAKKHARYKGKKYKE